MHSKMQFARGPRNVKVNKRHGAVLPFKVSILLKSLRIMKKKTSLKSAQNPSVMRTKSFHFHNCIIGSNRKIAKTETVRYAKKMKKIKLETNVKKGF